MQVDFGVARARIAGEMADVHCLVNQLIQLFGGDPINFFGEAKLFQPLVIGTEIGRAHV